MFNYLLKSIIPIIFAIVVTYGMFKGRKVYEWFIEGAKEGLMVCLRIFPYLLAMIVVIRIFRDVKLLDIINYCLKPISSLIGLPQELVPLMIIKPLSGSGALGVLTDILKQHGPDSYIGALASVIMGTTETIFYTISVYFGAVGIKKIRHTLLAAVCADVAAILSAIIFVKLLLF